MLYRSCQVWGRLKSYLLFSAAGFVALGGLGAAWSARPPVVTDVKAAAFSGNAASTKFSSLANIPDITTGKWSERLLQDLNSRALATAQPMSSRERHRKDMAAATMPTNAAAPASIWIAQNNNTAATTDKPVATNANATPAANQQQAAAQPDSATTTSAPGTSAASETAKTEANASAAASAPQADRDDHVDTPSLTTEELSNAFQLDGSTSNAQWATASAAARGDSDNTVGFQRTISVRRGDTLFGVLVGAGMDQNEAQDAVGALSDVFSPKALRVGQQITLNFNNAADDQSNNNGTKLVALSFEPSVTQDVTLKRNSDGDFVAKSIDKPLTQKNSRVTGTIDSSLFEAAQEAGLPVAVVSDLIKTFSYDVDFQRDIHDGDSFEVYYQRFENADGAFAKAGTMLYASLTLGGKKIPMYYFEHDGDGEYYSPNGESVRKSLLRTPVDGAKITSGFGMRLHPLLGYTRMHKGIDFGAPTGTPIYAAGNGVIVDIGFKSDYGNYIRIRHNDTYSTAYAHSSRFAAGLHKGDRVKQGEVIAYVGATGEATGPHLHYEILINNQQVNPATVKVAGGDKLTGKDLAAFKAQVNKIDADMAKQQSSPLVAQTPASDGNECRGPNGCEN
ncbi:MAG TPA: peptidoglycan DD-metalloendopeptidase family protein [Terriglobales bacterium]|nr:peptidoglycan DD-metalloendopeptidase family protein [Terriglobales bacterium]